MSTQSDSNQREKTLGENIGIVLLFAVMMAIFIYYFFKQETQLTQIAFDRVANNFSAKIMAVRAQWFMDNQPKFVIIKDNENNTRHIEVNKSGWVDFQSNDQNCRQIWSVVTESELSFMNQPVIIVEINNDLEHKLNVCRYGLPSGEYFDYYLTQGKVTSVMLDLK